MAAKNLQFHLWLKNVCRIYACNTSKCMFSQALNTNMQSEINSDKPWVGKWHEWSASKSSRGQAFRIICSLICPNNAHTLQIVGFFCDHRFHDVEIATSIEKKNPIGPLIQKFVGAVDNVHVLILHQRFISKWRDCYWKYYIGHQVKPYSPHRTVSALLQPLD